MSRLKKALDKAKETRSTSDEDVAGRTPNPPQREKTEPPPPETLDRCEINPTCETTPIVDVDPDTLRKNKIISLFHDKEMTDQIKLLRVQILRRMEQLSGNTLLITSAKPREGKTFTAINLGISIAQEMDRTVLLVDADLKHPSMQHSDFASDFFSVNAQKGLSDYLLGQAEIPDLLLNPGIPKLTILPGGGPLSNSAELLGSPRMEMLVKEVKQRYPERFIIFDSSSVLISADPLVFSRFVDGVLLVVEAEKTSKKELGRALELLKDRPIVGTLFNKSKG
jgi:non-specific protein-tyrosine kinase